jgi:DNA polymerase-3 subunit alpha
MISAPGNFIHLRVHSEYSVADGLVKVRDLVERARCQNMPAVALTDQGNLFGLIKFYEAALAAGVQPLIGVDLRYRDPITQALCRCLTLAADERGYRRIIELVSKAYVDAAERGWVERDWLCEDTDGMLLLSGGVSGDVGQALVNGDVQRASALAESWQQAYGERAYLELMRTGREGESVYVPQAVDLAQRLGMPVVATNDVCFLDRDDFEAHETRVCVHDGRTLNDPRRARRYSEEQYFKSALEMGGLFEDIPEALSNAVAIGQRCSATIGLGTYYLPNYPVPAGTSLEQYLENLSRQGLTRLLNGRPVEEPANLANRPPQAERYQARLDEELGIINQMGFAGYFLIVAEFIGWARENGIPVGPGRGSGAGSVVAWALGITGIDPIRYDLLFERFLNPERVSLPDFDIDFCMEGRVRGGDDAGESRCRS